MIDTAMGSETRIHLVVIGIVGGVLGLVALFWFAPRLIVYGLLGLAAVLAYGALYLIVAAWVDPKSPPGPLPSEGGSTAPTVIQPTDDELTAHVDPVADIDRQAETKTRMALEAMETEAASAAPPTPTPTPTPPAKKKRRTRKKTAPPKKDPE
ncbi:MAG: hypothetical protein AAFU77_12995 [Myxococcota bacterium]